MFNLKHISDITKTSQLDSLSKSPAAAEPSCEDSLSKSPAAAEPSCEDSLSKSPAAAEPSCEDSLSKSTAAAEPSCEDSLSKSPAAAEPSCEDSLSKSPAAAEPSCEDSLSKSTAAAEPSCEDSLSKSPAAAEPSCEDSLSKSPAAAEPSCEDSLSKSPAAAEPSCEDSLSESPAAAEPSCEDSLSKSPAAAEPSCEDSLSESPAAAEPSCEDSLSKSPAAAEPSCEDSLSKSPATKPSCGDEVNIVHGGLNIGCGKVLSVDSKTNMVKVLVNHTYPLHLKNQPDLIETGMTITWHQKFLDIKKNKLIWSSQKRVKKSRNKRILKRGENIEHKRMKAIQEETRISQQLQDISEATPSAVQDISEATPSAVQDISEATPSAVQDISEATPSAVQDISEATPSAVQDISEATPSAVQDISEATPSAVQDISEATPSAVQDISEATPSAVQDISEATPSAVQDISEATPSAVQDISEATPSAVQDISEATPSAVQDISEATPSAVQDISEATPSVEIVADGQGCQVTVASSALPTLYHCYQNTVLIGKVRCHPGRTTCHGHVVNENEVVIEVVESYNNAADDIEFDKGSFLKWHRISLEKIQVKASEKKKKGRGLKRGKETSKWDKNSNKRKREHGQEYITAKTGKVNPAKKLEINDCSKKKCKDKCSLVSEEERQENFEKFWGAGKQEQDRLLMLNARLIEKQRVSDSTKASKRNNTIIYSINGKSVCQTTFLYTFSITNNRINRLLKGQGKKQGSGNYQRKKTSITSEVIGATETVVNRLPKYNIHYSDTSKEADNVLYLAPDITIRTIFDLVVKEIGEDAAIRLPKYGTFVPYFKRAFPHVKIKALSTDKCNYCDDLTKSDEEKKQHNKDQKEALEQHKVDQLLDYTYTFDMQSTMPLPKIENNLVFYKRQLWLYNEGIHHHTSNEAAMFLWLESEAGKGSHEICSVLHQHMMLPETVKVIEKYGRLIYWCDSTVAQNRNSIVAWFLAWAVRNVPSLKSVTVKFFVTGHSYNAGDRDFGLIKKKLANIETIYTVDQYIRVIESARRKPSPFKVVRMTGGTFKDFTHAELCPGISFVPVSKITGKVSEDAAEEKIQWFNIRSIEATEDNVGYKIRYGFMEEHQERVVTFQKKIVTTRSQQHVQQRAGEPKPMYETGNAMKLMSYHFIPCMLTYFIFY